jgi:hypothetical protein
MVGENWQTCYCEQGKVELLIMPSNCSEIRNWLTDGRIHITSSNLNILVKDKNYVYFWNCLQ